jgi:hypothetical protein
METSVAERAATEPRESEAVGRGDGRFAWRWWRIGGDGCTCWKISRFFWASVGFWDEAKRRGRAKLRERLVLKQSRSIVSFLSRISCCCVPFMSVYGGRKIRYS